MRGLPHEHDRLDPAIRREWVDHPTVPTPGILYLPPRGDPDQPLRALLFDAEFDDYRGVIAHLRLVDGAIKKRDVVKMIEAKAEYEVLELGRFRPHMEPCEELKAGEVGYLIANVKSLEDVKIGDTVTLKNATAETTIAEARMVPVTVGLSIVGLSRSPGLFVATP